MRNRCDFLRAQPEYNYLLEPCLFELLKLLEYVGSSFKKKIAFYLMKPVSLSFFVSFLGLCNPRSKSG